MPGLLAKILQSAHSPNSVYDSLYNWICEYEGLYTRCDMFCVHSHVINNFMKIANVTSSAIYCRRQKNKLVFL